MRGKGADMRREFFGLVTLAVVFHLKGVKADDDIRKTFVIRYKDGENTIPVTVVLDYKQQTEYVINMNPRSAAKSVTLYDFKQRTIAYKDLTNRECFLGRLTHETLSEESNALRDIQSPVERQPKFRSLDPKWPALTPTEIRNIAGQKTAVFCRKMNTWMLVPEKTHSIQKRGLDRDDDEDDDDEDNSHQHHGTLNVRYFEHGKKKSRSYRNPSRYRNRSPRRQSAANNKYPTQKTSYVTEHPSIDPVILNSTLPRNSTYNENDHKLNASRIRLSAATFDEYNRENFFPKNEDSGSFSTHDSAIAKNIILEDNVDIGTDHPYIHPSLQHLLPLYKPLTQEFDLDSTHYRGNDMENRTDAKEWNLLREREPNYPNVTNFFPVSQKDRLLEDPDVTNNVLEYYIITNKLENISAVKNQVSNDRESATFLKYLKNELISRENIDNRNHSDNNSIPKLIEAVQQEFPSFSTDSEELPVRKWASGTELLRVFNTTEASTTRTLFPEEKLYVPTFHSKFDNTEDLSSLQILPQNISNTYDTSKSDNRDAYSHMTTQNLITEKDEKIMSFHRSDLPSEENDQSLSTRLAFRTGSENVTSFPDPSEHRITTKSSPTYRIKKIESIFRNFEPDEIVIDIESIPTQRPLPVTSKFEERIPVTETHGSLNNDVHKLNAEQTARTNFHSSVFPTSKVPKRKLIGRTPKMNPDSSVTSPRKHFSLPNKYHKRLNQMNRNDRVYPLRLPNRQRSFYVNRSIYRSGISSQSNDLHHLNHLGNLPPGVSVHPRHPEAPYADMGPSNFPPTFTLETDDRAIIDRHHRQRHHRSKEYSKTSCCRSLGKQGSFHSCCKSGKTCCAGQRRRTQRPCCSEMKATLPIVTGSRIHLPPASKNELMITNKMLDQKKCEEQKMCRTLYESTQKVMVCRKADIEGC